MLLAAASAVPAATNWDNTGNNLLNGKYYFRQVYYFLSDQYGDLGRAVALYGNIEFDGNGNYSITANDKAQYADSASGIGAVTATGTYSIAASGYGFISNPIPAFAGDVIYGLVSAQGIFVGSSTDNANGYNDMMVAAPVASPLPTASSFTGSWVCAGFDLSSGSPAYGLSLMFPLSPDGNGNLGSVTVTGYEGASSSVITQSYSGLKYAFSNGAAVASFPNSNSDLVAGQKYFYFSKDGNFMFGGAPNSFDMIVGVKTGGTALNAPGLYYEAGLDDAGGDLDSFYGSFYVSTGAAPPCATPLASGCQAILGHDRYNDYGGTSVYDFTYNDSFTPLSNGTYNNGLARYVVGTGGAVRIGSGIGPYLGISVGVQAPSTASLSTSLNPTGTGVFLDPTRIVNAASSAPPTSGIAPGELLTLYGSNLAAATVVAGIPFPTSLGNVQVTIGGLPAPIYYVSAGQISAIVPYAVTGPIVAIQVTNNGTLSNTVTMYVNVTSPGVFTQNQNGTGYGDIEHLDGTVVTAANPAHMGETVSIYLTGLGAVTPAVADGAPGPSSTLSYATGISVYFTGVTTAVTPIFAGLAPTYSGLYQLNVTIPATGLTAGDNYLGISGPDSYMSYQLIPISAATTSTAETAAIRAPAAVTAAPKPHMPIKGTRRLPGK